MAVSASQNISLNSTITVTPAGFDYYSRVSNTASGSLSFSVSVPSGATNVSATLYYNYNSSYSGAKVNGQECSQGAGYISLGAVSSANVSFSFKAYCESYSKGPPTSTVTRTASWSAYLAVTWDGDNYSGNPGGGAEPGEPGGTTPPSEIWNLYLNGVMGATAADVVYTDPGAAATLSWSADDTNIAVWQIHRKVNGGSYTYLESIAWQSRSATVYAASAGTMYQYMVLGIYANNNEAGYAYSPTLISRSAVRAPTWCSVSPSTRYPGESTTLTWGGALGGAGTSVNGYHIYCNGVYLTAVSGTSYTFAAPAAGAHAYQVYALSNIGGYNSGPSPAAGLTVANPKSTGVLDKSTVPMDDASTITLTVTPQNITYNHKAVWFIGEGTWTDTLATDSTESTLTVPLDWCAEVPNAASGTASVRLETYDGETLVGSYTYTFTATVPAAIVPTVSIASAPVDGFGELYIQGISKATLTPTAAGAQGSAITSYAFTGGGYSGSTSPWTTGILNYSGTAAMKVTVTDSRGRQASATVNITVEAYAVPIISAVTAYRSDSGGVAQDEGTNIAAIASLIVSPVTGNSGTATVRMRPTGGAWLASKSIAHTTLTVVTGTAQEEYAYEVEITLTDTIGKITVYSVIVPMVIQLYDFRMDRAGIGRVAGANAKTLLLPDAWTTNISLGNINGEGKVGTTADLTLMTGAGGLVVARTMAEAISIWKFTNPNLLHNADFRNPVNQRGVSGAISTGAEFYDRWIRNSGAVTTNAAYLTIGAGAVIEQRIEFNLLAGKTVTVSVMVGGTVYSGTGTMPTSAGTASVTLTGWGTATLGYATGYMLVRIIPTAASNIQAVKLELGTISTLAYDPPTDYGTELHKCQRYFRNDLQSLYVPIHASTTVCAFQVNLNPPMRVIPTISIHDMNLLIYMMTVGTYTPTSAIVSVASVSRYVHAFGGSFGGGTLPTINIDYPDIKRISASADL